MNAWRFVPVVCVAGLLSIAAPAARAQVDAPPRPLEVDWSAMPQQFAGQANKSGPPPVSPTQANPQRQPVRQAAPPPSARPHTAAGMAANQQPRKPVEKQTQTAQQAYFYYPATEAQTVGSQVRQASHTQNVASPRFYRISQDELFRSQPQVRQASHHYTRPYQGRAIGHHPGCACPTCAAPEPSCEPGCGPPSCDSCGSGCDAWIENDCWQYRGMPYRGIRCRDWCWTQDLALSVGMHTFESPADQGINGNYGFSYGLNWAMPVWHRLGIGAQIGYRGISADPAGEPITGTARQQDFFTVGFFHRPTPRNCWQWGVVWDWHSDDYFVAMELSQIRLELSRAFGCHEIGFWGALSTEDDVQLFNAVTHNWETHDQYNLFLRTHYERGIETRVWGGVTDDGDGLVGGDIVVPLNCFLAFAANAQFLIPTEGQTAGAFSQEAWATGLNVVFYPGGRALDTHRSRYRPLMDVADNATFLLNRLAP